QQREFSNQQLCDPFKIELCFSWVGVVIYAYDPSIWEAEAGRPLLVQGQASVHHDIWDSHRAT
ncbi:mCG1046370, partial [Mus musculus]